MAYFTNIKYQEYQIKNLALISPALDLLVSGPLNILLLSDISPGPL